MIIAVKEMFRPVDGGRVCVEACASLGIADEKALAIRLTGEGHFNQSHLTIEAIKEAKTDLLRQKRKEAVMQAVSDAFDCAFPENV